MHILCISHEFPPVGGGGATACQNITRSLEREGNSITVVTSAYKESQLKEELDGISIVRVKCKRKSADHSSFSEMLSFLISAWRTIPGMLRREHYDACLIFFGIPSGPLGLYLKKKYHIPYIVRMGGGDIPGSQKRFDKVYKVIAPILKSVWRNAIAVVANSSAMETKAKAFFNQCRFAMIPNGVDASRYLSRRSSDVFRLITVCRIIEGKGVQHVIKALPALVKATNGKLSYTIVGDGPYRTQIELLAKELKIEHFVSIIGMVEREKVPGYLAASDVFVFPSHSEGMPNVVLEAMAAGLPVVMTDCGGSKELIGDNGIVVPLSGDVDKGVEKSILKLLNDKALRERMGEASRMRVEVDFSWETNASQYRRLFAEVHSKGEAANG